jgi:hypothetical protein
MLWALMSEYFMPAGEKVFGSYAASIPLESCTLNRIKSEKSEIPLRVFLLIAGNEQTNHKSSHENGGRLKKAEC